MKNPFKKSDNTLLIAGIALGAAAVSVAYLFLTKSGADVRQLLSGYLRRGSDTDGEQETDPQAYLHHTTKAPKTDREALLKHELLHNTGDSNAQS